jgi:hypothetical protein
MSESMINTQSVLKAGGASAKIEEMLTLAKGQKAKALEHIIDQILSNPLIFVFGEFLSQPNFIEVTPLISNLIS